MSVKVLLLLKRGLKEKKTNKAKKKQVPSSNCSHQIIYQKTIKLQTGKTSIFIIYS